MRAPVQGPAGSSPTGRASTVPRRTVGLQVAVALAGLLLVTGLVLRATVGLSSVPQDVQPAAARTFVVQPDELSLSSSDSTPVFDAVLLGPGGQATACRTLTLHSTADPTPVQLSLDGFKGSEALARALQVTVEEEAPGTAPAAGCEGFVPARTVAAGSLASLGHAGDGAPDGWRAAAGTHALRYRLTVVLPPGAGDHLQGTSVHDIAFRWDTTTAGRPPTWSRRTAQLAAAVAEHSVVPLLLMSALAILFIGIQDRVDRHDPKLALASVQADQPLGFSTGVAPRWVADRGQRPPVATPAWVHGLEPPP